jgi:hypothetical protein
MKSPLQFFLIISAFLFFNSYGYAQSTAEPTIDSPLDEIQTLSTLNTNGQDYSVIVTGNNKEGDKVKIRMKLDNPADASKFTLMRLVNNVPTVPIEFNAEGIAILNAGDFYTLKKGADVNAAVLNIKFNTAGIFSYELQLLRDDGNILARNKETVRVASVAGLNDIIEDTQIKVYPVPVASQSDIYLQLGELKNASVIVMDVLGKPIYQADKLSGTTRISTVGFSKGIYFVKVVKGSEAALVRMVIQ